MAYFTSATTPARSAVVAGILFVLGLLAAPGGSSAAQALAVLPVNVNMVGGERSSTITVVNHGTEPTAIQIRVYQWTQDDGTDRLIDSSAVLASPPLATIAAGGSQLIRLVLRQAVATDEATYRIILDQIPPAALPGVIRVALRMSIPIFVEPASKAVAQLQFHIDSSKGQDFLVAINHGRRHEVVRETVVSTSDGRTMKTASSGSPYVLAGATRRWLISGQGSLLVPGEAVRLAGRLDGGAFEQQIEVVKNP